METKIRILDAEVYMIVLTSNDKYWKDYLC